MKIRVLRSPISLALWPGPPSSLPGGGRGARGAGAHPLRCLFDGPRNCVPHPLPDWQLLLQARLRPEERVQVQT
eukprot:194253-Rhodomonas_salina.1